MILGISDFFEKAQKSLFLAHCKTIINMQDHQYQCVSKTSAEQTWISSTHFEAKFYQLQYTNK